MFVYICVGRKVHGWGYSFLDVLYSLPRAANGIVGAEMFGVECFLPTEAHYRRMFGHAKRSGDLGLDVISLREARQKFQMYKEYVRRAKRGKNNCAIGRVLKAWLRKGGPHILLNSRVSGRVCQARAGPPPPLCSARPGRARGVGGIPEKRLKIRNQIWGWRAPNLISYIPGRNLKKRLYILIYIYII